MDEKEKQTGAIEDAKPSVPSENIAEALQDISGSLFSVGFDIKYGLVDLTKALFAIADSLAPIAQEMRCLGLSDLSRIVNTRLRTISVRVLDLSEQVIHATEQLKENADAERRERMGPES